MSEIEQLISQYKNNEDRKIEIVDVMYVHADNVNGEFLFKSIDDENIINKLKDKLIESK